MQNAAYLMWGADLRGYYANSRLELDGFPAPTYAAFADTAEYSTAKELYGYAGLFAFISGSSFVFIDYHRLSETAFGFCFAAAVAGYMAGTLASGWRAMLAVTLMMCPSLCATMCLAACWLA